MSDFQRNEGVLRWDAASPTELMRRWAGAFRRGLEAGLGTTAQVEWSPADQGSPDVAAKSLTWLEQPFSVPELVLAFGVSAEFAQAFSSSSHGDVLHAIADVFDRAGTALASDLQMTGWAPAPVHERAGVPEGAILFMASVTIGETAFPPLPVAVLQRNLTATAEELGRLAHATAAPQERKTGAIDNFTRESEVHRPGSALGKTPSMALMLDMQLPVRISLGKTTLALKDVLKLTTGSVLELNRTIDDPVEIVVNNCVVAQGEIVVVEGNYGTRIQSIKDRARFEASLPIGEGVG